MKLIYPFILIIFFSINLISSQYVNFNCLHCSQIGEVCTETTSVCLNGQWCGTPLDQNALNTTFKQCVKRGDVNSPCFVNDSCRLGLECYKENENDIKGTCLNVRFALNGETCSKDTDCLSEFSKCTNKVCSRDKDVNQTVCNYAYDCDKGNLCSIPRGAPNGSCQPQLNIGDECTANNNLCGQGNICAVTQLNGNDGFCKKYFSLQENEPCLGNDEYECDSSKNLFCNNYYKQCKVYQYIDPNITCTSSNQCNSNNNGTSARALCECNNTPSGSCVQYQQISSGQRTVIENIYSCLSQNNCYYLSSNDNSCVRTKCSEQLCDFYTMSSDSFDICDTYKAQTDFYCGDSSNGSSSNDSSSNGSSQDGSSTDTDSSSFKLLPSLSLLVIYMVYIII